jgi:hypothetical protein
MSPAEFRKKVVGLIDPNRHATGAAETQAVKETAVQLCLILCELYGDTLDRMKLWDRIATALSVAASKCDDGDTDRFISLCLEHVQADPAAAARHELFANWVSTMGVRDAAHRQMFVRVAGQQSYVILVHARSAWEKRKETKMAAKGGVK